MIFDTYRPRKVLKSTRTAAYISIMLLSVMGCTSAAIESTVSTEPTSSTVPAGTATTIASLLVPPSGETEVPCDAKTISQSYGEKVKTEKCTQTWAIGDTDRDSWNCPDEGCRETRVFRLKNNKWINTAICLRELPLARFASSCFVPNVGLATIDLIPPQDVACILWPINTMAKFVKETQCLLDENKVLASFEPRCKGFFEKTTLPLEKCNQGALVQQALTKLQQLGYVRNVDIYFGPEMARAVFKFQTDNNLLRTGIVDDETWSILAP